MRLIDADALLDDLIERYCKECDKRKGIKSGKWRIIYEIGDAPCRACGVDDAKAELEDATTIDVEEQIAKAYKDGFTSALNTVAKACARRIVYGERSEE